MASHSLSTLLLSVVIVIIHFVFSIQLILMYCAIIINST